MAAYVKAQSASPCQLPSGARRGRPPTQLPSGASCGRPPPTHPPPRGELGAAAAPGPVGRELGSPPHPRAVWRKLLRSTADPRAVGGEARLLADRGHEHANVVTDGGPGDPHEDVRGGHAQIAGKIPCSCVPRWAEGTFRVRAPSHRARSLLLGDVHRISTGGDGPALAPSCQRLTAALLVCPGSAGGASRACRAPRSHSCCLPPSSPASRLPPPPSSPARPAAPACPPPAAPPPPAA